MDEPLKGSQLAQPLDSRNLSFKKYIDYNSLEDIPAAIDFAKKKPTPWKRMGNWIANNCTCATAGHMIECWTANATNEDIVLTREVMEVYTALSGYNPETHENNDGLYYHDVLKYWRKNGIGGHKIKAYTTVDIKDSKLVRASVFTFGGAYLGLDLPNTIIKQELWDVKPGGLTGDRAIGSFGGHAVNIVAYDEDFIYVISWGKVKRLTWEFLETYGYVLYAIISEDFFNAGVTPHGLDLNALEEDLMTISKAKKTLERQLGIHSIYSSSTNTRNKYLPKTKQYGIASRSGKTGGTSGGKGGHSGGKGGKSGKIGGKSGKAGG
jgi:hypothetical protein